MKEVYFLLGKQGKSIFPSRVRHELFSRIEIDASGREMSVFSLSSRSIATWEKPTRLSTDEMRRSFKTKRDVDKWSVSHCFDYLYLWNWSVEGIGPFKRVQILLTPREFFLSFSFNQSRTSSRISGWSASSRQKPTDWKETFPREIRSKSFPFSTIRPSLPIELGCEASCLLATASGPGERGNFFCLFDFTSGQKTLRVRLSTRRWLQFESVENCVKKGINSSFSGAGSFLSSCLPESVLVFESVKKKRTGR